MRKLSALMYAFTAAALLFTSCGGDDETDPLAPTIAITTNAPTSVDEYTDFKFTIDVRQGDAKLSHITIREDGQELAVSRIKVNGESVSSASQYDVKDNSILEITITSSKEATSAYHYTVGVFDKDDESSSVEFDVVVAKVATATTYTAKMLGNQNSGTGSFLEIATGTVYSYANAKASSDKIDFVYYHGTSGGVNEVTVAAPSDATVPFIFTSFKNDFSTKNATKFVVLTGVDFSALSTTSDVNDALSGKTISASLANKLAVDAVIGFETVGGIKGIFKVTSITGSESASGEITMDVITNVKK